MKSFFYKNNSFIFILIIFILSMFGCDYISAETYYQLGKIAWEKKEYTNAVEKFTKALEINPSMAMAYFGRSLAWKKIGNIDKALDDVNRGIKLDPSKAAVYVLRGDIYSEKKEYRLALINYNTAITVDPMDEWLYLARAHYWDVNGNFRNEVSDLEKALKLKPSDFKVLDQFAWMLATCSDKSYRNGSKAVEFAEKAVKASRLAETLDTMAAAYAEVGRVDDAIKIQEESIGIRKKTGNIKFFSESIKRLKSYKNRIAWTNDSHINLYFDK
jgi:tetratricopeptide (TPR) repeat protein